MRRRQDQAAVTVGIQLVARDLRLYPPRNPPSTVGFADVQLETGFAAYWYLWAAGSTYGLADVDWSSA